MSAPIISVKNLSKSYRLGTLGTKTFIEEISKIGIFRKKETPVDPKVLEQFASGGKSIEHLSGEEKNTFRALKDISFDIYPGEIIGVIGKNGAGKSTLLKILSRITEPTSGEAFLRGRVASLLEVGTGFHPDLTGRENVYLSGTIHGLSHKEIDDKFEGILGFSQLEQFIDTPVKRYSSGMYIRLGFAVAAFLEPEILIVDEVLAVGDASFQKRCTEKMGAISKNGLTILLVSHNMNIIKNLCTRVIIIDEGKVVFKGNTSQAVDHYLGVNKEDNSKGAVLLKDDLLKEYDGLFDKDKPFIVTHKIEITGSDEQPRVRFKSSEDIFIKVDYEIAQIVGDFRLIVSILNTEGHLLISSQMSDFISESNIISKGKYHSKLRIPGKTFGTHKYIVRFDFVDVKKQHIALNAAFHFDVEYDTCTYTHCNREQYYLRPVYAWELKSI